MKQLQSRNITHLFEIKQDLDMVGYSIVDVLDSSESMNIFNKLMVDIETVCPGWKHNDINSWDEENLLATNCGFVDYNNGLTHSQSMWLIRSHPKILSLFANIYSCHRDNLIVSFDTIGLRYPPEIIDSDFDPYQVDPHVDQRFENNFSEPYQAIYCITDSIGPEDGGLVVYPYSHKLHGLNLQKELGTKPNRDFIVYPKTFFSLYPEIEPLKLSLKMGQVVLWDSRTLHGSIPIDKDRKTDIDMKNPMLNSRVVAYICYADRKKCSQEIIDKRVEAFNEGYVTNHMPLRPRFIKIDLDNIPKHNSYKLSLVPIEETGNSCVCS